MGRDTFGLHAATTGNEKAVENDVIIGFIRRSAVLRALYNHLSEILLSVKPRISVAYLRHSFNAARGFFLQLSDSLRPTASGRKLR